MSEIARLTLCLTIGTVADRALEATRICMRAAGGDAAACRTLDALKRDIRKAAGSLAEGHPIRRMVEANRASFAELAYEARVEAEVERRLGIRLSERTPAAELPGREGTSSDFAASGVPGLLRARSRRATQS